MGNTLRANVAEKLADIWLATHLRERQKRGVIKCMLSISENLSQDC